MRSLSKSALVTAAFSVSLVGVVPAEAAARTQPGTVIDSEVLPHRLWLPGTGRAYRLTYWTKNAKGKPAPSGGVVFLPRGKAPRGGWPVVSWAHGTVGVGDACAPSTAGRSDRDIKYLRKWLAQGYAIVATDYQGLGTPGVHPYGDGRTEAYNVTDMVRAGRHLVKSLAKKWVVIGQSQGGHATLFTLAIAGRYAPELDFRGGVATGSPSNIESVVPLAGPYVPNVPLTGLVTYFLYFLGGLRETHPELDINRFLTPRGLDLVDKGERLCYDGMHEQVEGVGVGDILAKPLFDASFHRAERAALEVPLTGYTRPFYLAHGMLDTDVPILLTFKLVADLRAHRAPVTFKAYPGVDHSGNMFASLPDTVPFVHRILARK